MLLGPEAASMLTAKGFPSTVRRALPEGDDDDGSGIAAVASAAEGRREEEARTSLVNLGISWGLVSVCLAHHLGHVLHVL